MCIKSIFNARIYFGRTFFCVELEAHSIAFAIKRLRARYKPVKKQKEKKPKTKKMFNLRIYAHAEWQQENGKISEEKNNQNAYQPWSQCTVAMFHISYHAHFKIRSKILLLKSY